MGNYQIRKIGEYFNRDRADISQDLKKVELHLREDKNSKGAMAVLENKLNKETNENLITNALQQFHQFYWPNPGVKISVNIVNNVPTVDNGRLFGGPFT